jgi:hypothetical protein
MTKENYEVPDYSDMALWEEDVPQENQKWVTITKIIVPTEYDKQQLLKAVKYIHDLRSIDTDYMAVNTISHLYCRPDLIEVVPD